jgi:heat shock protein HslJ
VSVKLIADRCLLFTGFKERKALTMRYVISILLLPILFLIGCAAVANDNSETAANPAQLQNHWLLVELNGQSPMAGTEITLIIESDSLGGNSGCNSYGGSYAAGADGRIEMSEIFSTLMACLDDGVMEQEAAFSLALRQAQTFELADNGQTLLLRNAAGEIILRFTARAAPGLL